MKKMMKTTKTKTPKLKNKKTVVDGIEFDSKKEAMYWLTLRDMEARGEISDLRRQVKFILIPAQREKDTIGARGRVIRGKVIERELSYIADFVYRDNATGKTVVCDVKGYRKADAATYRIFVCKRKLMLEKYGIRVVEV